MDNLPDTTPESFFKVLARVAFDPEIGCIFMLKSKNGKPLGYTVLVDVTELYQPKVCCIYIVYSNRKCPSTITELRHETRIWAKEHEFVKFRAISFRIRTTFSSVSGAVRRYFGKTLGLRERCVVFEAPVE